MAMDVYGEHAVLVFERITIIIQAEAPNVKQLFACSLLNLRKSLWWHATRCADANEH